MFYITLTLKMKIRGKTFVALFLIVFAVCIMITSFIIAGQHTDTTCDIEDGKVIVLSMWLRINAGFLVGFILGNVMIIWFSKKDNIFEYGIVYTIVYFIAITIMTIIGAVQLFKFSKACRIDEPTLWNMTLALLIFNIISILYSLFSACDIFYKVCDDDVDYYI